MSASAAGEFQIINQLGLHARAAAQLVQTANRFQCEVWLTCEGQKVNGKSIMGVLMLAAGLGMKVYIECIGTDADTCLNEMSKLIAGRFGEAR